MNKETAIINMLLNMHSEMAAFRDLYIKYSVGADKYDEFMDLYKAKVDQYHKIMFAGLKNGTMEPINDVINQIFDQHNKEED